MTPWTATCQTSLPFTISGVSPNSCSLIRWCHPTISTSVTPFSSFPPFFPASRFFSSESALHIRWLKYWSFSCSISSSNEYSRLISFRIDWFYLLAVQGTLKSLLLHHNLKGSVLCCSAFFMVEITLIWQIFMERLFSKLFLPMNIQDWFPLGLTGFISLLSKGLTGVFLLQYHSSNASVLQPSAFFMVQLSHPYMTTGRTIALTGWTFVGKVMSLLFICCLGWS